MALFGRPRGYRCLFVVPEGTGPEKLALLEALGAEVRVVPERPCGHPESFAAISARIAAETPGGWWADQFDNPANHEAHYRTTGPEIWTQTKGRIDAFVAAVGIGGTLAGISRCLKERKPAVRVLCADPPGAAMWSWFKQGHLEPTPGGSVAEGVGQCRVTAIVAVAVVDDALIVPDQEAVDMAWRLSRAEGLFTGFSSALNVAAAERAALDFPPGAILVTILCDGGAHYVSTLHNPAWLTRHGLRPPE